MKYFLLKIIKYQQSKKQKYTYQGINYAFVFYSCRQWKQKEKEKGKSRCMLFISIIWPHNI